MQENLKAYIDGELSPQQAHQVEVALQRDAALRQEFDEMRRISSTLRESHVAPAIVGLDATLVALKKHGSTPTRPPLLRFAPAAGVVFACAIALVTVGKMNHSEPVFNDASPAPVSKTNASAPMAAISAAGEPLVRDKSSIAPADGRSVLTAPVARANANTYDEDMTLRERQAPRPMAAARGSSGSFMDGRQKDVVKTGEIQITVPRGKDALQSATQMTKGLGGLVETSNLSGDDRSGMVGNLTLRIPVARFEEAMAGLEKLGKVTGQSSTGNDVTAELTTNDAKLRTMRAQELDYETILKQAKHVQDVLSVKEQLDQVQQELAEFEASQKALKNQAAMSTISLTITQPAEKVAAAGPVRKDWIDGTWKEAWGGLAMAGRTITAGLIYLVVFCPIWIPVVLLARVLTRRVRQLA
jgi:hypothetical protein